MTTTELIELLKKYERGGATGRPRELMFEVDDRIIDTDGIEVTGSGDGLISELYLSLPSAQPIRCGDCMYRDPEDHKCDCGHTILWQLPRDDKWFCADAKRKEGEVDG